MKKTIYKLPVPSTALFNSPEFQKRTQRRCVLICKYESEPDENEVVLTMTFEEVEAFKCTYHMACGMEISHDAYDKVIDYGNTEWLEEIKTNLAQDDIDTKDLSHLAIYFDDGPAYEFICRVFRTEEELKPL